MSDHSTDPAAALAAMHASRARLPAECPPQRHGVFAFLFSLAVAAQAASGPWLLLCMAAVLACVAGVAMNDRRKTGVFTNGWRAGRTRGWALGLFAVYLVIDMAVIWLKAERGVWWAPFVGAVVFFPFAFYASRRWSQTYRRELDGRA